MTRIVRAGLLASVMSIVGQNAYAGHECTSGDLAGKWILVGTAVSEGASQTVWCSPRFTEKTSFRYSISGTCQSQSPFQSSPQSYTISGNGTVTENSDCVIGGTFKISGSLSATVTIVTGQAEGNAASKTHVIGVARYPNPTPPFGGTPVIQTFSMVR